MTHTTQQEVEHLTQLASDLQDEMFTTALSTTPDGRLVLAVRNSATSSLSERVHVEGGQYLWSWGQPIAPVSDRKAVIRRLRHVLAERPS